MLGLCLTGMMAAQEAAANHQESTIRVHVNQVLLPVIVTDRKGHFRTDLRGSDFYAVLFGLE